MHMNRIGRIKKAGTVAVWLLMGLLGFQILVYGARGQSVKKLFVSRRVELEKAAAGLLYPGLTYAAGQEEQGGAGELLIRKAMGIFPVYLFLEERQLYETETESSAAYEILTRGGIHDENEIDAQTGEAFDLAERMEEENRAAAGKDAAETNGETAEEPAENDETDENGGEGAYAYTMEELSDFTFLKEHFYVVESTTDVSADVLDARNLLGMDMELQQDASEPQILIYHTHSQEGFVDSVPGDNSTTIVGVGEYLTELLRDRYGYQVLHNTNVYDLRDGELDRNRAYSLAAEDVKQILTEHPSIEVLLDLHRDGVKEGTRLVTEVNGKPTAQFMFFNGLSYSKRNGPISYLENPYIQENLALSLQLKLACETYYPGLSRKIYLKGLRYNLHLRPKSLLVEAGAQTNTLEEMRNAMEPLADVLNRVLKNPESP